ncbi:MAG: hypothetical protein JSS83_19895 [Cyanobacteria bacterium SZAS LIN-3]|nr:hypothetical protein [Cyanobacteria bacterium SZAS LIN-3]MBS2005586.1 hypothetical protein [Cyanobacteria bacterium SZAS TMP-1]
MTLGVAFTTTALIASHGTWTSESLIWSFCAVADSAWLLAIVLERRKKAGSFKAALPLIAPILTTALLVAGMPTKFTFSVANFPYLFAGGLFFCACLDGFWHCLTFVFPGINSHLKQLEEEAEAQNKE